MSQAVIAQVGLLVAILSLIATLIAPRFVSGARVFAEAADASRLDADEPTDRLQVRIYHDNEAIAEPVYLVTIVIENTGGKDVTKAEFIDPVRISLGGELEILSAAVSASDGVSPAWSLAEGIGQVSWSLLKPGETITVRVVARAMSKAIGPKAVLEAAKLVVRLRDVKVGRGWKRFTSIVSSFLMTVVAAGVLGGGAILLGGLAPKTRWVYQDKVGQEFTIVERRDDELLSIGRRDISACPVLNGRFDANSCVPLNSVEARSYIASAERQPVKGSISRGTLALIAVILVVYALVATLFLSAMSRLLRRTQKRNLARAFGVGRL